MEINKLNLNVIKKLLHVFSNKDCDNVLLMDNFTIDGIYGRYYSIHLYGNCLCCKCSDGRIITVELEKNRNSNESFIIRYKYNFDNSSSISNNIQIVKGNSEYFDDNIDLLKKATISLSTGKSIKFVNNSEFRTTYPISYLYSYDLDEKEDCHAGECYTFKIIEDGIIFNDGSSNFLISKDLIKVISINGEKAPTFDECKKFNTRAELSKIKRILNDKKESLHPFIINDIDCLKDVLDNLYLSNYQIADICDKKLSICKKELEKFRNLIENLNKRVFCEEEINKFIEIISVAVDKYNFENKSLRKRLK